MANIEIEKKGGSPKWLWIILALLAVAALAWWLFGRDGEVDQSQSGMAANPTAQSPIEMVADERVADGPVTDLPMLAQSDAAALVGRQVDLSNVVVGEVVGDASFWIEGADGSPIYVVLDEQRTPDTSTEGRVDINPGDRIDLMGTVASARNGVPEGAAAGSMTDPLPSDVTRFIYAQSADVVG